MVTRYLWMTPLLQGVTPVKMYRVVFHIKHYISRTAYASGNNYGRYQKGHGRDHVYNEGLPFILPNETGGQPHNNMPPYLSLNYIIKT